ncbi:hypothetical protein KIN20_014545 [Parelaphostrongylus tenuis]|uniref:Uncharacterized protein n=1 Tax=Parelaphostrongylus tenuis TaxID=148309 RepID=A0AAD5MW67_PARTN|nr:hypothetical protein KIN20_014545 [Parelaphostrongylus tenuis]
MSTGLLNPDDADDSDSSDSTDSPVKARHRSATVSPSARNLLRDHPRRRSDFNLYGEKEKNRRSIARNSREPSVARRRLRKTNSEPNVEGMGVIDIIALSKLLNSIPKITTMQQDDSDFCGEDMLTEIEELRDAAKSIQSLQRVLKRPQQQHSSDRGG